jgi:hypothetical protein
MPKPSIKRNRGIGLLELMLSIMVITALLLASTRYYITARDNMRMTQAVEIINNVAAGGFKWLEGRPDLSGISITTLANYNLVPKSYTLDTANPWKGQIYVYRDVVSTLGECLVINLYNFPRKLCTSLINKIQNYFTKGVPACYAGGDPTAFQIVIPVNP